MEELTIVTAFWDIGRKDFNLYPRTNKQYIEYFKFWARMQNNLIVYTYKEMGEEIKKIRQEYGLLDKTTIIEINDETSIENDIFKKMQSIQDKNYINEYRYTKGVLENNAKYDYVMLLKYWCIADAKKRNLTTNMIAWLDLGFNHGNDCYTKSEEFDFLWKTNLQKNKVHLFNVNDMEDLPIFELVRNMDPYIMGAPVIVDANLAEEFWNLIKESMLSLIRVGFIDDDQLLLLMAYREKPEIFEVHKSTWFMPLKENGGEHLTVKNETKNIKRSLNDRIYDFKRFLGYIKRQKKYFK